MRTGVYVVGGAGWVGVDGWARWVMAGEGRGERARGRGSATLREGVVEGVVKSESG